MAFTKGDMFYEDYKWSASDEKDNPKITGEPDRTLLDRNEGYEVLYFVNACAKAWNWNLDHKASYQKIEKILRKVPSNLHSQANIKQWIEQNHKAYWDDL